jgi:hypothetical protein
MLVPCLKALIVGSFKITGWARALLKHTDYDLRSFGVPPDQAQRQENDRLGKGGKIWRASQLRNSQAKTTVWL